MAIDSQTCSESNQKKSYHFWFNFLLDSESKTLQLEWNDFSSSFWPRERPYRGLLTFIKSALTERVTRDRRAIFSKEDHLTKIN